jgi:hypothetical protein
MKRPAASAIALVAIGKRYGNVAPPVASTSSVRGKARRARRR